MVHLRQFLHHPAGRATGIIFALCGLVFGTWASFIPYVKEKFVLDEAQLGLLLLCMPVGTLIANPLSVSFISRWGAVKASLVFIVLMGITFTLPIIMPHIVLVGISLAFGGATFALANVAMNTCASDLEEENGVYLMSTCHGMWSLGAMTGALISGLVVVAFNQLDRTAIDAHGIHVILIAAVTFLTTRFIKKDLQQIHENWQKNKQPHGSIISMFKPNKTLWILISISLCTYLTEGTMADWSAVYLREVSMAPETIIGWGFGLYAFFMAFGRFMGDALIARYGNMRILMIGGLLVVLGLIVIVLSVNAWSAFPGFMLTGLGVSVASPILYQAAAKVPGMPPGAGLATMNSFGMAAFLGGPVLIGLIAKTFDLRFAFMVVSFAAMMWALQTYLISRKKAAA